MNPLNKVVSIFSKKKVKKESEEDFLKRQEEANPFTVFLRETQSEMTGNNVKINLVKDAKVFPMPPDSELVNGYFDDSHGLEFMVCIGKPLEQWMPVYVHEYCHFRQWKERADVWLNGTDLEVEADCERRSVAMIKEHNLPIDADEYAQAANSYIHFYNYIDLYDVWYTEGKEPYRLEEVWSQFPTEIDDEFPVSWEYIDLYNKHCF